MQICVQNNGPEKWGEAGSNHFIRKDWIFGALLHLIATFCSANFSENPWPESSADGIDGLVPGMNFLSRRNDNAGFVRFT